MAESLSINGTALSTLLYAVQAGTGLVGAPPARGADYELPRFEGALEGPAWAGPRILPVRGLLVGNSGSALVPADARARMLDRARALIALVVNNGDPLALTRVIPRASGGDLTVEAVGRYLGGLESVEEVAAHAGRVAFDLQLLDAFWHATADTTFTKSSGTAGVSIVGDTRTTRITLEFAASATPQTLTNHTTGEYINFPALDNDVIVDCEAMTAYDDTDDVSVAGLVTQSSTAVRWMSFVPGTNSLTLSGATSVGVAYRAAYL